MGILLFINKLRVSVTVHFWNDKGVVLFVFIAYSHAIRQPESATFHGLAIQMVMKAPSGVRFNGNTAAWHPLHRPNNLGGHSVDGVRFHNLVPAKTPSCIQVTA